VKYDTSSYKKHKCPQGWGSLCPDEVSAANAVELLMTSCQVGNARYNVDGDYCYRALSHGVSAEGDTLWHGHPIPWTRLPTEAKKLLVATGRLTSEVYRKALRRSLGKEFER
jgi:hypothetical protein